MYYWHVIPEVQVNENGWVIHYFSSNIYTATNVRSLTGYSIFKRSHIASELPTWLKVRT